LAAAWRACSTSSTSVSNAFGVNVISWLGEETPFGRIEFEPGEAQTGFSSGVNDLAAAAMQQEFCQKKPSETQRTRRRAGPIVAATPRIAMDEPQRPPEVA
jgi:hypothetical protein